MGIRDIAKKLDLIRDVPTPTTGDGATNHNNHSTITEVPRRATAADILLSRRSAGSAQATPPRTEPTSLRLNAPVAVDQEYLEHFRKVADSSTLPGYLEFFRQVGVLGKHIKNNEEALFSAALESANIEPAAVIRAIEDRSKLVREDKEGALGALAEREKSEISASRATVNEITSTIERLRAEIAERETRIASLTSESRDLTNELSDVANQYSDGKMGITGAADQVLAELHDQKSKVQNLK